ncbi:MAG TPA: PHP domain-containing protein, partial [Chitinophagaceae bacterium]|nr:PHP domain-containing protein [Chitinophagaceae bacterium]
MNYTELQITTNFSFLKGASHPHELVQQAATLGYTQIGITDHNTLAGIVRAHTAAKQSGIRIIIGSRLDPADGPPLLAYPTDLQAYSRLASLLTTGNLRTEKGKCLLYKEDIYAYAKGIKFIALPPFNLTEEFDLDSTFKKAVIEYKDALGEHLYLAATKRYQGDDSKQLFRLAELSRWYGIPLVATNDVYYHTPSRRRLQDVLTCIREGCTIYNAGYRLYPNAERHLKSQVEMHRLFRNYPEAIQRTEEIAQACRFSLDELKYEYPEEITTEGRTPQQELTHLAWKGAKEIFGEPLPQKIVGNIQHELAFIEEMNYASYFLTVYDIVKEARARNILCQGRGSAANSTVCFCLGITS